MIIRNRMRILTTAIVLLLFSANSVANSVTILGDSPDARECYLSTQMQTSSNSEIQSCTNTLSFQSMRLRDRAVTFINRGIIYVPLEEYELAIKDYASAKKIHPDFGAIYVNRGNLFFIGESYDSAILEYSKALNMGLSQDYVAHLNRGMAYEKLGRLNEAVAGYREAIELAPEWKAPKSKLERALIKIN